MFIQVNCSIVSTFFSQKKTPKVSQRLEEAAKHKHKLPGFQGQAARVQTLTLLLPACVTLD